MNNIEAGSNLYLILGASGAGKDTILTQLMSAHPRLLRLLRTTSRPKREGEVEGENYHFITRDEFLEDWDAMFGAYTFNGHLYGVEKQRVFDALATARPVVCIGGLCSIAVRKVLPDATCIYIDAPPDNLRRRLLERGENANNIEYMLAQIVQEWAECDGHIDFKVVNPDNELSKAVAEVAAIIGIQTL